MITVQDELNEHLPTDSSLLARIRAPDDAASWREFFETYKDSIAGLAITGGLSRAEAEEVVQETMLAVSRGIATFQYDRKQGSFKGWIFTITRRAMFKQIKKRLSLASHAGAGGVPEASARAAGARLADSEVPDTTEGEDEFASLPDTTPGLEEQFEKEWRQTLLHMALQRVRARIKPKQFQMFDLYVNQQMPMARVKRTLRVNSAQVYMAKIRVSALLRQTIAALERELI